MDNNSLYRLAELFTCNLLDGVVDKQGQPAIDHAVRVFNRCQHLDRDQRLASLLHDVLGDGTSTIKPYSVIAAAIGLLFGVEVLDLVSVLTRQKATTSYEEYIRVVAAKSQATPIKLADLEDNLDPSRGDFDGRESLRLRYERAREVLLAELDKTKGEKTR